MKTDSPTFVVYGVGCGHVVGITNTRVAAEHGVAAMGAFGHRLRIRSGATGADIEAVLRGDRCEACEVTA